MRRKNGSRELGNCMVSPVISYRPFFLLFQWSFISSFLTNTNYWTQKEDTISITSLSNRNTDVMRLFLSFTRKKSFPSRLYSIFPVIRTLNLFLCQAGVFSICYYLFSVTDPTAVPNKKKQKLINVMGKPWAEKKKYPFGIALEKQTYLSLLIFKLLTLLNMGATHLISTKHTVRKYGREVAISSWYKT